MRGAMSGAGEDTFDLAVVGGGIIGVFAAWQAAKLHPDWHVLLAERSLIASGATRYSVGLHLPFGRTAVHREMEIASAAVYRELAGLMPELGIRRLPFFGVVSKAGLPATLAQSTTSELRVLEAPEAELPERPFPGFVLGGDQCVLGGARAGYSFPDQIALHLAWHFAEGVRGVLWEGVEITAVWRGNAGLRLSTADGREIAARRVVLATGPWALRGPGADLAREAGVRIKKVVALHLDRCPEPGDPILFFFDEDAFLLPVPERREWLFSFTCRVWDPEPEASELRVTESDRELGLAVLSRYCPGLASSCRGGRVFCDAYGPDWTPVVKVFGSYPGLVLAGAGSGSGCRLAPAIARQALNALESPAGRGSGRAEEALHVG